MTVKHSERPGYTTAEDKREFVLASLAGYRFEKHTEIAGTRRALNQQRHYWLYIGPHTNGSWMGRFASRRGAVYEVLRYLEENELAD